MLAAESQLSIYQHSTEQKEVSRPTVAAERFRIKNSNMILPRWG